jgi:hypothetical protein
MAAWRGRREPAIFHGKNASPRASRKMRGRRFRDDRKPAAHIPCAARRTLTLF